jgi:hypothetical protein
MLKQCLLNFIPVPVYYYCYYHTMYRRDAHFCYYFTEIFITPLRRLSSEKGNLDYKYLLTIVPTIPRQTRRIWHFYVNSNSKLLFQAYQHVNIEVGISHSANHPESQNFYPLIFVPLAPLAPPPCPPLPPPHVRGLGQGPPSF